MSHDLHTLDAPKCVYLAGPMRGYPAFNFAAFDAARDYLSGIGFTVVSPADLDRDAAFDPHREYSASELASLARVFMRRDITAILDRCTGMVFLPGWEKSRGCAVEYALAKFIGLELYEYLPGLSPEGRLVSFGSRTEGVEIEARRIVGGERNQDYGHPFDDFTRTALMWSAIIGRTVTAEQVAMCMVGLKLSRQCNHPKRDNLVDGVGYFLCLEMVQQERARRVGA